MEVEMGTDGRREERSRARVGWLAARVFTVGADLYSTKQ
jgi:hypothetical protein